MYVTLIIVVGGPDRLRWDAACPACLKINIMKNHVLKLPRNITIRCRSAHTDIRGEGRRDMNSFRKKLLLFTYLFVFKSVQLVFFVGGGRNLLLT